MKFSAFFFLLFISKYSYSQSIPLDSFYTKGTEWIVTLIQQGGHQPYQETATSYKIENDSVIFGKLYHLVTAQKIGYVTYYWDPFSGESTHFDNTKSTVEKIGGIRTDSNKVYFIRIGDTTLSAKVTPELYMYFNKNYYTLGAEKLMYNFNLKVGDTASFKDPLNIVEKVDSVKLSTGVYVKRILFDTSILIVSYFGYPDSWIFGLGGSSGLLDSHIGIIHDESNTWYVRMLCYNNSIGSYNFIDSSTLSAYNTSFYYLYKNCFENVEVPNISKTASANIYPNPLTGNTLNIEAGDENIKSINIYDITGRELYHFNDLSVNKCQLNLQLEKGYYLVKLWLKDSECVTRTIIKM